MDSERRVLDSYRNPEYRRDFFQGVKRVVLKIGTSLLSENGELQMDRFQKTIQNIVQLKRCVPELVVVTSGAVGAGYKSILKKEKSLSIPLRQALASIGQVFIMKYYMDFLKEYGFLVSQILLTEDVLNDRSRYVNTKNTIHTLLQYQVIPIVNENDTVSAEGIKFGDNDTLSALVSSLVDADLLILLSHIDGFYLHYGDPKKQRRLSEVTEISSEIESSARGKHSLFTLGGMKTKLKAAKLTTREGIPSLIAGGLEENLIPNLFSGADIGTLFLPTQQRSSKNRKRWIHLNSRVKGKLIIDKNAVKALVSSNKSLLPKGIIDVEGLFENYDTVEILSPSMQVVGKGISNYSSEEVKKIRGRHSLEIEKILGYRHFDVVVHKDNLVIFSSESN